MEGTVVGQVGTAVPATLQSGRPAVHWLAVLASFSRLKSGQQSKLATLALHGQLPYSTEASSSIALARPVMLQVASSR
jgi:hypothetical protein